jgi:hypothetical protein
VADLALGLDATSLFADSESPVMFPKNSSFAGSNRSASDANLRVAPVLGEQVRDGIR